MELATLRLVSLFFSLEMDFVELVLVGVHCGNHYDDSVFY